MSSNVNEDPFVVNLQFDAVNYSFSIYPSERDNHLTYVVGLDGVDLGELMLDENTVWQWVKGGFDGDTANAIGSKIESYYD